jgi:hypothetical protein
MSIGVPFLTLAILLIGNSVLFIYIHLITPYVNRLTLVDLNLLQSWRSSKKHIPIKAFQGDANSFRLLTSAVMELSVITLYVYHAENSASKNEEVINSTDLFFATSLLMLCISLITLKKSNEATILNRDQTSEFKGW